MALEVSISRTMNDNLTEVRVGDLTLWFSYETIVAFREDGGERVFSVNEWSQTTNRHLNSIGGHAKNRTPHTEFLGKLIDALIRRKMTTVSVKEEIR